MNIGIAEFLKDVSETSGRKNKIQKLQSFKTQNALQKIIDYTFNPLAIWELPEGTPPFTKLEKEHDVQNVLYNEIRRLYLYIRNGKPGINNQRREEIFIQLLESVDPDDAELLLSMKENKLPYKGLTKKLMEEAFPELDKKWQRLESEQQIVT